jgi:hypothetical protein
VFVRFGGVQKLAGFRNAHLPGRALIFCRLLLVIAIAFVGRRRRPL